MGNSITPTNASQSLQLSAGLAKRGLELVLARRFDDAIISEEECVELVKRKTALASSIGKIPVPFTNGETANPHGLSAFDPNRWLSEVYDCIHLNSESTLDYVYAFDGHGGEPFLYTRRQSDAPLNSIKEYLARFGHLEAKMLLGDEPTSEFCKPFTNGLSFARTPIGYLQFALFCMTARRFYLFWHSNYNDRKFILTRRAIQFCINNKVGDITNQEQKALAAVDPRPRVRQQDESAQVSLHCFEQNLGYSKLKVFLRWPNVFERFQDEIIIKAHSRILY